MKNILLNKYGFYFFLAGGLILQSCQNEFDMRDRNELHNGDCPLKLTVGIPSRSTEIKKTWEVNDVFGVKLDGQDVVGKYKITDVASGATEAVDIIKWHTAQKTNILAWYPYEEVQNLQLGGYEGANLLMANVSADYTSPANLVFTSPLAKVICVLNPAPGVALSKDLTVSFNSYNQVDYVNGEINPEIKGEVIATKETIEGHDQYVALLVPGEISTDEYFLKVVSGSNTYKMSMSDAAKLNAGKTYTFNITVKDRGEIVWSVSTLAGTGTQGNADEKITSEKDAISTNLYKPFWLTKDNNNNLYYIQYDAANKGSLNKINLNTKKVITSVFRNDGGIDGGFANFYVNLFTPDYKNLVLSQDRGMGNNDLYSFYLNNGAIDFNSKQKESERVKEVKGLGMSPIDKEYLFVVGNTGTLYRYKLKYDGDKITSISERTGLGNIQEKVNIGTNPEEGQESTASAFQKNWYDFNIQFAPDGTYAYFVTRNRNVVVKAEYDKVKHEFVNFSFVAGKHSYSGGYADGAGNEVMFKNPHQGAFDTEGNFYLCDSGNHCIRKINSQGNVTTFAGNPTKDEYKDGALNDATFKAPIGIVFDSENNVFYVSDWNDNRIRVIKGE